MARLPTSADLATRRAPANSQAARAPIIDYSQEAQGAAAIGRGVQSIGKAGIDIGAEIKRADEEVNDYETRKRLLDFEYENERALEEAKRNMPAGGAGYTDAVRKDFMKRAKAFVGENDKNIPEPLRQQVGLLLKKQETTFLGQAQNHEWAARDAAEIEGLEETLGRVRSKVESNPTLRNEMLRETERLIELSRLSPDTKARTKKKMAVELDKAAGQAMVMRANTKSDYDALFNALGPETADAIPGNQSAVDFIKRQEGDKDSGWDFRQFSGPYGVKRGANEKLSLEEADKRLRAEVSSIESEMDAAITAPMSASEKAALTSLFYNIGTGKGRLQEVAKLINGGQKDKVADWIKQFNRNADGGYMEGLARRRSEEAALWSRGSGEEPASKTSGPTYAGPFGNLTLSQRKELWNQAETKRKAKVTELDKEIGKLEAMSTSGYALPEPMRADLEARIAATGEKSLITRYTATVGTAEATATMSRMRPGDAAQVVADARAKIASGATPEQEERVRAMEKTVSTMHETVKDDALTWANRVKLDAGTGQPVKLEPLDFNAQDIGERLARRAEQAKTVGAYYGQPPQYFTKAEREALGASLKKGGDSALYVMGTLYRSFGTDTLRAAGELLKDAPEAYMIGRRMVEGGDPAISQEIAKGLELRQQAGEKFVSSIKGSGAQERAMSEQLRTVFANTPQLLDPVQKAADAAYEYRARLKGLTEFDQTTYDEVLAQVIGQSKGSDGQLYGGIGTQGDGYVFSGAPVVLPPSVRQDAFDDVLDTITPNDFDRENGPQFEERPMRWAEVRASTWVYVGPGQYAIKTGDTEDGASYATTKDGKPFILDLNQYLPKVRERRPDLFRP